MLVSHEGILADLGPVHIADKSVGNILSQAVLTDAGCKVALLNDEYHVTDRIGSQVWVFRRRMLKGSGEKSRFYSLEMDIPTEAATTSVSLTMTVGEDLRRLTVCEQQQTFKAARLGRLLGNASPSTTIEVLKADIMNCDTTATDVHNATRVWGKGLAVRPPSAHPSPPLESWYHVKCRQRRYPVRRVNSFSAGCTVPAGALSVFVLEGQDGTSHRCEDPSLHRSG